MSPVYTRTALSIAFKSICCSLPVVEPGSRLDISGSVNHSARMQSIKISSKVDEDTWNELKALAKETHQNVSGLLTEAIRDYVRRKRVRPEVVAHLDDSIEENEELGRLLAR